MRIIAGTAGRVAIKVPSAVARPSTDFVRQALFSIIGEKVHHARVLDLFSGSGAIGLEALSRGALSCTFVDHHRQAVGVITENLQRAKLVGGNVVRANVASYLQRDRMSYDLIFADPPYWQHYGDVDELAVMLKGGRIPELLSEDGWFIGECGTHAKLPDCPPELEMLARREYGSSAILLYAKVAHP